MKILDSAVTPDVVTESGPSPSLRIHAKGRTQITKNTRRASTKIRRVCLNEAFILEGDDVELFLLRGVG